MKFLAIINRQGNRAYRLDSFKIRIVLSEGESEEWRGKCAVEISGLSLLKIMYIKTRMAVYPIQPYQWKNSKSKANRNIGDIYSNNTS